jgi:hypothetical protein
LRRTVERDDGEYVATPTKEVIAKEKEDKPYLAQIAGLIASLNPL